MLSLAKALYPLLCNGETQEDMNSSNMTTIVDWGVMIQYKQTKQMDVNQSIR